MFSDRVAQNPTIPVKAGINTLKNEPKSLNLLGSAIIGPKPFAAITIYITSTNPRTMTAGAAQFSNILNVSIPLYTIHISKHQKIIKPIAAGIPRPAIVAPPPIFAKLGNTADINKLIALPPTNVLIPNHPHATTALAIAGMFAPNAPKEALANTGNGIPYFAPGCPFRSIGNKTIRLPSVMVRSACFQSIPSAIKPPANIYVGMQ